MYEMYTLDFYRSHEALPAEPVGILWGTYEDIRFRPLNSYNSIEKLLRISEFNTFDDTTNLSEDNKIDFPNSMLVLYSAEKETDKSKIEIWNPDNEKDLLSIILVSCDSPTTINPQEFAEELHKNIAPNISCSCFGTFGMYELCVLIKTNDISEVFDFVEYLQVVASKMEYTIRTSYTLVYYIGDGKRCKLIEDEQKTNRNNYIANIQITYNSWFSADIIVDKFRVALAEEGIQDDDVKYFHVLGEYDLCIHVPAEKLPLKIYRSGGFLCSNEGFFKTYIKNSCTRLARNINIASEVVKEEIVADIFDNNELEVLDVIEVNESLQLLNQSLFFKSNNALKRLFHILNIDFLKAYNLKTNSLLKEDLKYQFCSIITCVSDVVKNVETDEDRKFSDACYELTSELARLFSKSVCNVIFTDKSTVNEPYTYLDNAALFPKIIQQYTGFIKNMLIFVYANSSEKQSELVPIVYIDSSVNVPMSDLYIQGFEQDKTETTDRTRIISFRLPFDAVINFETYLPLLIHEISHYLCPTDRSVRNKFLFKINLKHYFSVMLYQIHTSLIDDNRIKEIINSKNIREFVCEWIEQRIDQILTDVKMADAKFFNNISADFSVLMTNMFDSVFSKYKNKNDVLPAANIIIDNFVALINDWFIDCLKCTEFRHSINKEKLQETVVIVGKNKDCIKEIEGISGGIKEIVCDIMMIQCFSLKPEVYFSLVIIAMLNQNIKNCDDIISMVRFGHIRDYYGIDVFDEFNLVEYTEAITNIIRHINSKYSKEDISKLIITLDSAMNRYRTEYIHFESDIKRIVECYPIYTFNSFNEYIEKEFVEGSELYNKTRPLITIFNKIGSIFEEYKCNSKIVDDSPSFNAGNCVEIMNLLQEQLSLKEIGDFYRKFQGLKEKKVLNDNIAFGTPCLKDEIVISSESECQDCDAVCSVKILSENIKKTLSFRSSSLEKNVLYSNLKNNMGTEISVNENYGIEHSIKIAQQLLMDNEHPEETLWYRGQSNASWPVSPAIFRKDNVNFHEKLLRAYEMFRAEACEALEIHTNIDSKADWISCMQHYFIPTHFLDWSEQPLASLYFALENYFVNPCKYCNDAIPDCDKDGKNDSLCQDAALYVLNPHRMNRLLSRFNGVPNISINYNEKRFKNYIFNPEYKESDRIEISSAKAFISTGDKNGKCPPPLAVITSQLNSRIKAQKGHFIAYDLNVRFVGDKGTKITNLYEIEREYFEQCIRDDTVFEPFMAKIIIRHDLKQSIASTLKAYGINKSSIYPELMHIGNDITQRVFTDN